MIRWIGTGAVLAVLALPADTRAESLAAQFERFLSWWPGTYDNAEQARAQPGTFPNLRLHLQPMAMPAFGEKVVFGE